MKTLLKVIGFIVVGVIVLAVALPFLIPTDYVFKQVTEAVEKTTGRTLTIKGEKALNIFPQLSLELNDVHFSNMAGGSQPNMVSMKQLAVHIPYLSAITGDIKLEKFVINEPQILLEKMSDGTVNWQLFESVKQPTSTNDPQVKTQSMSLPAEFDFALGEVAVYGGQFTYIDHQTKSTTQLSDLALVITLPSLRKALNVSGNLRYMEQTFKLNAQVSTPEKVITGQDFELSSKLDSELVKLDFTGGVKKSGTDFSGELDLHGDSVKQLLAWQNIPLEAKTEAFNGFGVSGKVHFADNKLSVSELNARLDKLDIKGKAEVNLAKRLFISADVDLGELNVNPYLPESIEASQPSEQENTKAQPIVWDDTHIDLSALGDVDASIRVRSTAFQFKEIKLGENAFSLNLKNAVATLSMDKFIAYQGNGVGKVKVNAATKPYQIDTDFALSGIQAEPLLTDAAGFDKLMGQGQLGFNLNTRGLSQKDFIAGLDGKFDFSFADGAVKGANLAAMVRSAKSLISGGGLDGASLEKGFDKAEKTDFSELVGSFTFDNGVSKQNELSLKSPLLRVTGKGDINLVDTELNYRLVTGIVDSIEGQGTTDGSTGFKIPVRIKGSFHDVKVKPDIKDAAKEEAKDKLKDKVKDKLKNLFG